MAVAQTKMTLPQLRKSVNNVRYIGEDFSQPVEQARRAIYEISNRFPARCAELFSSAIDTSDHPVILLAALERAGRMAEHIPLEELSAMKLCGYGKVLSGFGSRLDLAREYLDDRYSGTNISASSVFRSVRANANAPVFASLSGLGSMIGNDRAAEILQNFTSSSRFPFLRALSANALLANRGFEHLDLSWPVQFDLDRSSGKVLSSKTLRRFSLESNLEGKPEQEKRVIAYLLASTWIVEEDNGFSGYKEHIFRPSYDKLAKMGESAGPALASCLHDSSRGGNTISQKAAAQLAGFSGYAPLIPALYSRAQESIEEALEKGIWEETHFFSFYLDIAAHCANSICCLTGGNRTILHSMVADAYLSGKKFRVAHDNIELQQTLDRSRKMVFSDYQFIDNNNPRLRERGDEHLLL